MKKLTFLVLSTIVSFELFAQASKSTCQVLIPETKNMTAAESSWLPGLIQSKLEANLQDYLGLQIVADSSSEAKIKKLQAQSESNSRDQADAIEIGKIISAKFALISQIIKSNKGYSLSTSYTDVTTGQKLASAVSKEYILVDSLYGDTGAVDDITIKLADKLGIKLSDLQKKKLSDTSKVFTLDEELAISKENDEQYQKMQKKYDEQLAKLMASNDLSSIENRKRIEADKALLQEKQNSEKRRQQELEEQKKRNEEDSKLESERSIALKTHRDKISKEAAEKAEEVRNLKIEKQGVLGQINVLEAKKKALVEIRQSVEERCLQLHTQFEIDTYREISSILFEEWKTIELKDGKPVDAAKQGRANRIKKIEENALVKFYSDCDNVKNSTIIQQNELIKEINNDKKKLASTRTVSSLGDELKVSYGSYDSSSYGWNAYLSFYSDGILMFQDNFIVNYETLVGKYPPKLESASIEELNEYENTMDMYTSLLVRGVPLLYFELDYSVTFDEEKTGEYHFNYDKVRVINTLNGKVIQTSSLNNKPVRTISPAWDIREQKGIVESEKSKKRADVYTYDSICNGTANGTGFVSRTNRINTEKIQRLVVQVEGSLDIGEILVDNLNTNLESLIFIGLGNEKESIIKNTFYYNNPNYPPHINFENFKSLKNIILVSVNTVNKDTFMQCKYLQSLYINNVKEIGEFSFSYCDSLADVYIFSEDSVNLASYSFSYCNSLENVIINSKDSIEIGEKAFFTGKSSLSSVEIKSKSLIVNKNGFLGCRKLVSIVLPSVDEIRSGAFEGCGKLESVKIIPCHDKNDIKPVCFYDNVFLGCSSLKYITFDKNIQRIYFRKNAFAGCNSLQEVKMSKETYEFCRNCKEKKQFYDNGKVVNEATDKLKSIESKIKFYE